jgi:thymidine kinase
MAKLFFKYGAMGSTKTLTLLTMAYNFEEKNINFMCFKPSTDTRDGENIIKSRVGIELECSMIHGYSDIYQSVTDFISVMEVTLSYNPIKWLLIDESQFLTKEHVDQLSKIVDELDINVMCFGLRTDFKSNLFEGSKRLFEIADSIEEIKTSCKCGNKAIINARFDKNNNIIKEGEQIKIGGNESYISMCRKCWNNNNLKNK